MLKKIDVQDMGSGAGNVFRGDIESEAVKKAYGETAIFFAQQIRQRLNLRDEPYTIADIGTFKGELLENVLLQLPEYKFLTIGIDVNQKALSENTYAQKKVIASADSIPLDNHSVDVAFARYLLQWNNIEKQKKILSEIVRITREFAIIEHSGPDIDKSDEWRIIMNNLFDGKKVPKMKREGYYYSSYIEVEEWLIYMGIKFERVQQRVINGVADIFIARYDLDQIDANNVRIMLDTADYFVQTDWIIFPKK